MLRLDMAACVRHCFFYPSSFSNSLNNFTFPLLLTSTFAHTSNLRARVRRNDSQRHQRALCSFCTNASPFSRFHSYVRAMGLAPSLSFLDALTRNPFPPSQLQEHICYMRDNCYIRDTCDTCDKQQAAHLRGVSRFYDSASEAPSYP